MVGAAGAAVLSSASPPHAASEIENRAVAVTAVNLITRIWFFPPSSGLTPTIRNSSDSGWVRSRISFRRIAMARPAADIGSGPGDDPGRVIQAGWAMLRVA
ncbi:hypothetical protein Axi01nite_61300 [Actinoplanes xinjiangensis]|nr:hypothetical protein Axi01nite_61300 [Actinoplanes xinjiangensis]